MLMSMLVSKQAPPCLHLHANDDMNELTELWCADRIVAHSPVHQWADCRANFARVDEWCRGAVRMRPQRWRHGSQL